MRNKLLLLVAWATLAGGSVAADCATMFDSRQVLTLNVVMDPSEWNSLREDARSGGFFSARLSCEGGPALSVGIRRRTHGGDSKRVSLEVAADRFVKGQTLAGQSAFALFAGTRHPETAVPGKRRSFVNVLVNGEFVGLYTLVRGNAGDNRRAKVTRERRSAKNAAAADSGALIVVNEVLANTPGGDDVEFIELFNAGTATQDLAGLYLLDDDDLHDRCLLEGTLGPGAYLVVPGIRARFLARFPGVTALNPNQCDSVVAGQGFALGNGEDRVRLFRDVDSVPELLDILTYGRQGTDVAFGYRPADSDAAEYLSTPTPGVANDGSELHSPICINEFLTTSMVGGVDDWVELYNRSDAAVDIGGWFLSDSASNPQRYAFPAGTVVPPGGFLSVDELTLGFSFSSVGSEVIMLTHADGATGQDYYDFGPQFADVTQGRFPDGSPNWHFFVSPSRAASNACDAGPTPPAPVSGLSFSSPQALHWNASAGADAYDVVNGDLVALRDARGDYSAAVSGCSANNSVSLAAFTDDAPSTAGQGNFYLGRGVHFACGFGTYDTGSPFQAAGRDAGIAAAPGVCP